jgi:hypothetical protein
MAQADRAGPLDVLNITFIDPGNTHAQSDKATNTACFHRLDVLAVGLFEFMTARTPGVVRPGGRGDGVVFPAAGQPIRAFAVWFSRDWPPSCVLLTVYACYMPHSCHAGAAGLVLLKQWHAVCVAEAAHENAQRHRQLSVNGRRRSG